MEIGPKIALDEDKSVLMIGNHISWWDGFWPIEMNRRLWKRSYFVMMLETQLSIRPFLRQGGAFSIQPGSRDMIASLRYASSLLGDPRNIVLIFPQGKIHSQYARDVAFAAGVEKILRQAAGPVQVLFYAAFLDYGSFSQPTLRIILRRWDHDGDPSIHAAYLRFFNEAEAEYLDTDFATMS